MSDFPVYHIDVLRGPFWEVDTENCETILVQAMAVGPNPGPDDFAEFIDVSSHASGEAVDWRRVAGYAAVLRSPSGRDMAPTEGPYEDPKEAWTYVADTWGDRVPPEGVLADYEDPEGRLIAAIAERIGKTKLAAGIES